jgi:hypothetical protein
MQKDAFSGEYLPSPLAPLQPEPLLLVVGRSRLERGVNLRGSEVPLSVTFPFHAS